MSVETITPNQFIASITTDSAPAIAPSQEQSAQPEETLETSEQIDETTPEVDPAIETEALEEAAPVDAKTGEEGEPEQSTTDEPEPVEKHIVKIDGKEEEWTLDELVKSAERQAASTKRFQAAAEKAKEAEAKISEAAKREEKARATFDKMLTDDSFLFELLDNHAPAVFEKIVQRYAKRANDDRALYDANPDAYNALANSRKEMSEARKQRDELQRREEEARRLAEQTQKQQYDREYQNAVTFLETGVPNAVAAVGIPIKSKDFDVNAVLQAFRVFVKDNYAEGDSLSKDYLLDKAREWVKNPLVKAFVDTHTKKQEPKPVPKKEAKEPKEPTRSMEVLKTNGKRDGSKYGTWRELIG